MTKRATFDELLEFCNKVREAGGAELIDALMPSEPENAESCLIARNVNFGMTVNTLPHNVKCGGRWAMQLEYDDILTTRKSQNQLGKRIATALNLPFYEDDYYAAIIVLPEEIGQVAADFDQWSTLADELDNGYIVNEEDITLFEEFLPYIDQDTLNSYSRLPLSPEGKVDIRLMQIFDAVEDYED